MSNFPEKIEFDGNETWLVMFPTTPEGGYNIYRRLENNMCELRVSLRDAKTAATFHAMALDTIDQLGQKILALKGEPSFERKPMMTKIIPIEPLNRDEFPSGNLESWLTLPAGEMLDHLVSLAFPDVRIGWDVSENRLAALMLMDEVVWKLDNTATISRSAIAYYVGLWHDDIGPTHSVVGETLPLAIIRASLVLKYSGRTKPEASVPA